MTKLKDRALELLPEGTDPDTIHKVTASQDGIRVQLVTGTEITLKATPAETETAPRGRRLSTSVAQEELRQRIAAETKPTGRGDEATGQNYGLVDDEGKQTVPVIFPEKAGAEIDFEAVDDSDIEEYSASELRAALSDPAGGHALDGGVAAANRTTPTPASSTPDDATEGFAALNAKAAIAAVKAGEVNLDEAEATETARDDGGRKTVLEAIAKARAAEEGNTG